MKRLLLPLTAVALVGLLWQRTAPANACGCDSFTAAEYRDMASVIAIGEIVAWEYPGPARYESGGDRFLYAGRFGGEATMVAERYMKGTGPRELKFRYDLICGYAFTDFLHERYLAFLHALDNEVVDSPCFGSGYDDYKQDQHDQTVLAELIGLVGTGIEPSDSLTRPRIGGAPEFPTAVAAVAATAGPLVFLAASAFVWRRKGGAG